MDTAGAQLTSTALDVRMTPEELLGLCEAMELDRRLAAVGVADQVIRDATALGRADLAMRGRLVKADALARQGDPTAAAKLAGEVLESATASEDGFVSARAHFQLAIILELRGDLPSAAHHACLSVDCLPDGVHVAIRARHLATLALTLDDLKLGDGEPYHQEALDIAAATGDVKLAVGILANLVWDELFKGDVDAAWALVGRIRQLTDRSATALRAADVETIALVEIARGEPAAAEKTLQPLLDQPPSVVLTEAKSLPCGLLVLAQAQRHQGRLVDAQDALDRSRALCEAADLGATALRISEEQAELFAAAGRWEEAYAEHRRFYAAGQALQSAKSQAEARATQAQFESREEHRETKRYREMALRDSLTGLYNRRFVDHQLPALITRCRENRQPLSVALLDVDFFKRVNDTLSHEVGDVVLQKIAELMGSALEEPTTVARLGGEEFLLVLPNAGATVALEQAEMLRRVILSHAWGEIGDGLAITVSIGVTTTADGETTQAAMLQQADRNLYAAKRSGRNRVLADPG